jgi:hypothetical protein
VIEGAQYTVVSEETPTPGSPIDLPQGRWFVHEIVATWSDDRSSQLIGGDPHYGGTLICGPTWTRPSRAEAAQSAASAVNSPSPGVFRSLSTVDR